MTDDGHWPDPWIAVEGESARGLEKELRRECSRRHPLYRARATAIAHCPGQDDVLFRVDGGDRSFFAMVHLTWNRERSAEWPWTEIYDDLETWRQQHLTPDPLEIDSLS